MSERYYAIAEVNYYEMEGEWNTVEEAVGAGTFNSVNEAKDACARRRGDSIEWTDNGNGNWQGNVNPNDGNVTFYISKI